MSYSELDEFDARQYGVDGIVVSICWDPFDISRDEAIELYEKLGKALRVAE